MKAAVCEKYGPPEVLRVTDVEKPVPGDKEVLIRIRAVEVTSGDARIRGVNVPSAFRLPFHLMMGFGGPRNPILGGSFSGEVESVGAKVTGYSPGDQVVAFTYESGMGGYAQYRCLAQDGVIGPKPCGMSFEKAAGFFFGGHTALHFLRKGDIRPGQEVLVYGASGAVGVSAVQLSKHYGARVTGVAGPANQEMVASLGADEVIDYTREDFTTRGARYDIIFDTVGKAPFAGSVRSLKDGGYFLRTVHMDPSVVLKGFWTNLTSGKKVVGGMAVGKTDDLRFLTELVETGELRSVIDQAYPLEQVVEAHRHVDGGHKKGSVILQLP
jgi:NADPH:quinone reductase-like Zn-dependent oxidoreductase